jgi:hypothetical protein
MARLAIVAGAIAVMLTGCTGLSTRPAADATAPSAAIPQRLESIAGHWQGSFVETGGWYFQASKPLDLTISPSETWTGTIGDARASGTARLSGRLLILRGTARSKTGHEEPVYLSLTGDDTRRWGETRTQFSERDAREERASVSLRKTS